MGKFSSNVLKPGEVALACDTCSGLIRDDEGFLCVIVGRDGSKRWRSFHDDCDPRSHTGPGGDFGRDRVIVRSGRVATFSQLLTTIADLARDPRIDFGKTAWPALLQRIAFDTDWQSTDGRKRQAQLLKEHAAALKSAGFTQKMTVESSTKVGVA